MTVKTISLDERGAALTLKSAFGYILATCLVFDLNSARALAAGDPALSTLETSCPALVMDPGPAYWLCSIGNRDLMLNRGNLAGQVLISDLPDDKELIAVGPVAELRGEITVYRGKSYVSIVENGRDVTRLDNDVEAAFLAFGSVREWEPITISESLEGFPAVEAFIRSVAVTRNLDPEAAFPFRIEGTADKLDYHIIFKTEGGRHNLAAHRRAKIPFTASGKHVAIAGIWADREGVGRYTHPGRRSHMHVVVEGGVGSGHIDTIRVNPGSRLYLPRANP